MLYCIANTATQSPAYYPLTPGLTLLPPCPQIVPILRAGLLLTEQLQMVLPFSETYHLGVVRDEETLQPKCYLNKLPAKLSPDDLILITDPMLATGGTIM